MTLKAIAFAMGALLPLAAMANADAKTFEWTLTGPLTSLGGVPDAGAGTLTASLTGGNWEVDSISGLLGTGVITGLSGFAGADNLLFPQRATYLDTNGLSVSTTLGDINIAGFFSIGTTPSGNAYGEYLSNGGFGVGTFSVSSAVPEPSTWAMMLIGFGGIGYLASRKLKTKTSLA